MRAIFSLFLASGLALLFVHSASTQNITIELIPITYPIQLPASGGTFDYLLTVSNQGEITITATVWCGVTLPGGSSWGPVVGPSTQTLSAGQTQSYYRSQTIPPRAPQGTYIFTAYVGIYPDSIWANDQFRFEKLTAGSELWVARYNTPGWDGLDHASSLAVDDVGNVYVTGWSWGGTTEYDYATIKYDASGNQLWEARYNGPGDNYDRAYSLAVDGDGNVYVTGRSFNLATGYDYATIKYDPSGNQLWEARYNGPGNGQDYAYSLAVDGDGNAYVTGASSCIPYPYNFDYATIKYDASGNQLWVARYNGPVNYHDHAYYLAVDDSSNVYVTGTSIGSETGWDYVTIKYDASGNQLWEARYNGSGNSSDIVYSLAVDDNGNTCVTGGSSCIAYPYNFDYATVKYDPSGNQLWVARYNGPGDSTDNAYSLAVDAAGCVYVTGGSYGSGTDYDYVTVKYDAYGNQLWLAHYDGSGNATDVARSMAVDGDGNVYVTGGSIGSGTVDDYTTIKYDASGNQLWVARYNGPGNGVDDAYCLALDAAANVYVTGESYGHRTNLDYATIKYSSGNLDNWLSVEATVLGVQPSAPTMIGAHPNPFNPVTTISFNLPMAGQVKLEVFDIAGRRVGTSGSGTTPTTELINGWRKAGFHEVSFDGSDLASGVYIYRLRAGNLSANGKMVLMK